jgi:acyl-CoA synthetase (AMP-forming)/AMP-acid ligase II
VTAHLLHHLLEAAADTHPERPAVVDRGTVVSYGSLEERANRLAHLLLELGVRRGDRVGLLLGKSPDALVAIYGTSKAGAGYVPLDPQAPPSRLAAIARNAGIRCLLVAAETAGHVESLARLGARVEHAIVLDTTRR